MGKVAPSRAVSAINKIFPSAREESPGTFGIDDMSDIKSVLRLINEIPEELITLGEDEYPQFLIAVSELQAIWEWLIANGTPEHGGLQPAWNFGSGGNPVAKIISALKTCPDEYPAPESQSLLFVKDAELRDSIRQDVGAVERALRNSEWKAATVLSGSAIEALLLWKLATIPQAQIDASVNFLTENQNFPKPNSSMDRWGLDQMIKVAEQVGCIKPTTAKAADLAKDFRNLIHPGKAIRIGAISNRAAAYSAAGALEHVIEDFNKR